MKPGSRIGDRSAGFSLVELLVALAVFATMAALAYGGLGSIVRTRGELAHQQARLRALMRSVALLERDLRQAAVRPVRGNDGAELPAFVGTSGRVELTRIGFANPQAEVRSNLERVFYALDGATLDRGSWPVLDRAPATAPTMRTLLDGVDELRLRYLDGANRWSDRWPPLQAGAQAADVAVPPLPRAVEFRITSPAWGEITRTVELVSPWPQRAVEATQASAP